MYYSLPALGTRPSKTFCINHFPTTSFKKIMCTTSEDFSKFKCRYNEKHCLPHKNCKSRWISMKHIFCWLKITMYTSIRRNKNIIPIGYCMAISRKKYRITTAACQGCNVIGMGCNVKELLTTPYNVIPPF